MTKKNKKTDKGKMRLRASFLGALISAALIGSGIYFFLLNALKPVLSLSITALVITLIFATLFLSEVYNQKKNFGAFLLIGVLIGGYFSGYSLYPLPLAGAILVLNFWLGTTLSSIFALFAFTLITLANPANIWVTLATSIFTMAWYKQFQTVRRTYWYFLGFFALSFGFYALRSDFGFYQILNNSLSDTGIVFGFFVVGVWFFVNVFRKTFFLRLLELLNPKDKLLIELKKKAPGTYHHSLLVATIASYTAERIENADPLLTQVGGQFHDIGKMFHAKSFVENQYDKNVKTSRTKDHILAHVNDGIRIAQRYGLPEAVQDIIRTHHGDTVTGFYFAEKNRAKNTKRKVKIEDFRYPGPKPFTKEQALVVLADSTEAAIRSKGKHQFTKKELEEIVNEIITSKVKTHQLDNSPLTMHDIKKIHKYFVEILVAINHARVNNEEENKK